MKQILYRFWNGEALLYVGISINAYTRAKQHSSNSPWWDEATHVTFERFDTRAEVEEAETVAIRTEKPKYNYSKARVVQHKIPGAPHVAITPEQEYDRLWLLENTSAWLKSPSRWVSDPVVTQVPKDLHERIKAMHEKLTDAKSRSYSQWCVLLDEGTALRNDWLTWLREAKTPMAL